MNYNHKTPIPQWAEDDRPREKLMLKGKSALTDAELLAILMRSGNSDESAVELAKRLLHKAKNNIHELAKMSFAELTEFKGIGQAKALSIIAALEIGNRKRVSEALERKKISSSKEAFEILSPLVSDSSYEEFWILMLNRSNEVLDYKCISEGGISGTIADPKKIFRIALQNNASAIILCHNHPSGNTTPSAQDINITKKLKESGKALDMPVLDHIIIGTGKYYSFSDNGTL